MTFFIQSCPRCARRFNVHIQLLGKNVHCQFCNSIFPSHDGSEDSGEASDRIDQWAKDQNDPEHSPIEDSVDWLRPK